MSDGVAVAEAPAGAGVSAAVRGVAWARVGAIVALGLLVLAQGRSLTSVILLTAIWSISAVGLGLVLGRADQPLLSQASFMLVGAYAYAWICSPSELGLPTWLAMVAACLAGGTLAALVSPVLQVRGYTFAIATIAVALLVEEILSAGSWLPGGELGVLDVPPLWGPDTSLRTPETYAVVSAILLGVTLIGLRSVFGRGRRQRELATVAGDSTLLAYFGADPVRTQQTVLLVAGTLGGVAGALHAGAFGFVQPASFGLDDSFVLAVAVVIGGRGRLAGAVVGALLFESASSALGSGLATLQPVLVGAVLIATMHWFPEGLLPTRRQLGLPRAPAGLGLRLRGRVRPSRAHPDHDPDQGPPAATNSPLGLEIRHVRVDFGSLRALDDVDLDVRAGDSLGVIGPNGAGKTTLLGVLSGNRPSAGSIVLGGSDVVDSGIVRRSRTGISRTFQHVRLVPELSVLDNVMLGADAASRRLGPWTERQRRAVAADALGTMGIDPETDAPTGKLDLTTARLVEMARVLAARPGLALLDEPSSGLDGEGVELIALAVRQVHGAGCTVLVVEHDLAFVEAVTGEVVSLLDGRTGPRGSMNAVLADPDFRHAYLGGTGQ